jgi:hypothetical protein
MGIVDDVHGAADERQADLKLLPVEADAADLIDFPFLAVQRIAS